MPHNANNVVLQPDSSFLRTIPEDRSDIDAESTTARPFTLPLRPNVNNNHSDGNNSSLRGDPETRSVTSSVNAILPNGATAGATSGTTGAPQKKAVVWTRRHMYWALGALCLFVSVIVAISIVAVRVDDFGVADEQTTSPAPAGRPNPSPTGEDSTVSNVPNRDQEYSKLTDQLVSILSSDITPASALVDNTTAQGRAVSWMVRQDYLRDDVLDFNTDAVLQRFALVAFYFSIYGENAEHTLNTATEKETIVPLAADQSECSWPNVECTTDKATGGMGRVTRLLWMRHEGVSGTLPPEVALLTELEDIKLAKNSIQGNIPSVWFDRLTHLTSLDLSENELSGSIPTNLWVLSGLRNVALHGNRLSGQLSVADGTLSQELEAVRLHRNSLEGTLPSWFLNLPALTSWSVLDNALTGTIPADQELPVNLYWVDMGGNKLSGEIPLAFWTSDTMKYLYLDGNPLTGSLPNDPQTISTNYRQIWLNNTQLSGSIPKNFAHNWSQLEQLYLHNNPGLLGTLGHDSDSSMCLTWWPKLQKLQSDCQQVKCACCDSKDCT